MPDFIQTPAVMGITFVAGDQLDVGFEFKTGSTPINLPSYTFDALVYPQVFSQTAGSFQGGGYTQGTPVATFTISPVDLTLGKISLGLTETQTAALNTATTYRWYLRWLPPSGQTLTLVAGDFKARAP